MFIPLGPLRDRCCFCPPLVPAGGSGCHSRSWRSCHPWAQRRAVPAASPCAFACLGWPWPLQLAPCGCSGAAVRGWTAATGPAHTARFVLGILGKTRVKKGKRKAFAFPEGKGGRARQQGQGSIQTSQQTLFAPCPEGGDEELGTSLGSWRRFPTLA